MDYGLRTISARNALLRGAARHVAIFLVWLFAVADLLRLASDGAIAEVGL